MHVRVCARLSVWLGRALSLLHSTGYINKNKFFEGKMSKNKILIENNTYL